MTNTYPRFLKRFRAVLIDSVILPVAVIGALIFGNAMGVTSGFGKGMMLLLPLLLLEPAMVAFTGGTIGHHLMKIRVAKMDGSGNINFFSATIRFMMRTLLGGLSLIFVFTTAKHQALHDLMARSVVIHKDPTGLPEYDVLAERKIDLAAYVYPAIWRRVIVAGMYWLLLTIALGVAIAMTSSDACMSVQRCTAAEEMLEKLLSIIWLVCLGWVTVRAWGGRLFGCRRRVRVTEQST
jgi:uncharacterized RDD family membrane protein YckC